MYCGVLWEKGDGVPLTEVRTGSAVCSLVSAGRAEQGKEELVLLQ